MTEGIDENLIDKAGEIIRGGGLVAFPTETVYGLGGDALNADSSRKIYAAKGRPSDNPLIVHIEDFHDLERIVSEVPENARKLNDAFWPGPLTMILKKNDLVPMATTGGLNTVAIRMPSHKVAAAFIRKAGGFIAAPSANTSGRPSPSLASHVKDDLDGKIDMIIDGGPVDIGLESTIIDLTEDVPVVLRPGYISIEMLRSVLGDVKMDPGLSGNDPSFHPKAPGMKYRHYAPKASLTIIEGRPADVESKIRELTHEAILAGRKCGVIATSESTADYPEGDVKCVGTRDDELTIAQNLFRVLREFDDEKADVIYSEGFDGEGIGTAIMNRLVKAAGHQIIQV